MSRVLKLPRRTPTTWSGASSKFCRGRRCGPVPALLPCRQFRPPKSFIASPLGHPCVSWPELYSTFEGQDTQRSEEHTSELQSHLNLVCRLLLEKKKIHRRIWNEPAHFACHWPSAYICVVSP